MQQQNTSYQNFQDTATNRQVSKEVQENNDRLPITENTTLQKLGKQTSVQKTMAKIMVAYR